MSGKKYAIRLYTTDDDGNITSKSNLYSPYIKKSRDYTHLGETNNFNKLVYPRSSGSTRLFVDKNSNAALETDRPHLGASAWGLNDPNHSIYHLNEVMGVDDNDRVYTARGVPESVKSYARKLVGDKTAKDQYKESFDPSKEFYNYLQSTESLKNGFGPLADPILGKLSTAMVELDPEKNKMDKDEEISKLMDMLGFSLLDYKVGSDFKPVFTLVSAPEDKFLTVDDVNKNGLTKQRDTSNEMIMTQVTPEKVLDVNKLLLDQDDMYNKYGDNWDRQQFLYDHGIDPDNMVSDVAAKNIMADMSNDLDGIRKQTLIKDTLMDVSRF